jgi:hypothetical protein
MSYPTLHGAILFWSILAGMFGFVLLVGVIGTVQKRRHPPSEYSEQPDDFINDARPFMPSSPFYLGKISRLR